MGFNAVVVVLNDRLAEIERDPEFGKKLAAAIRYQGWGRGAKPGDAGYRPFGNEATGQTQVISVAHADNMQIVAVGGNTGQVLGYSHWRTSVDDMIADLNRQRLERRRAEKRALETLQQKARGAA